MSDYLKVQNALKELSKKKGVDLSLDRIEQAHRKLKSPSSSYKSIHIAGSSGKGSVCRNVYQALLDGGYSVGLYTSPHILSVRERIEVGGELISKEDFVRLYNLVIGLEGFSLTFFEVLTLIALRYFKESNVDFAVVEVGLGGMYDATNIIIPEVCAITSIQNEHKGILGATLEEIALQKAGIIKKGVPVVIGSSVPESVIKNVCSSVGSDYISIKEASVDIELCSIAKMVLSLLRVDEYLGENIQSYQNPFRFAVFPKWPSFFDSDYTDLVNSRVILDGAHHSDQLLNLAQKLESISNYNNRCVCFTLMQPKDLKECLDAILKIAPHIFYLEIDHPRCYSVKDIKSMLRNFSFGSFASSRKSEDFLDFAQNHQDLVITGSYYIFRNFFSIDKQREELNVNEQGFLSGS